MKTRRCPVCFEKLPAKGHTAGQASTGSGAFPIVGCPKMAKDKLALVSTK